MAYLCSLLLFNCRYLRLCTRGILALSNETQKLSRTVPNLKCTPCLASPVKYSSTFTTSNLKPLPNIQNVQFCNKIEELRLPHILKNNEIKEGVIVNTFKKFMLTYHVYKGQKGVKENVNFYLESPTFIKFFEVIDKELPKFSASSLVTFYELKVFKTPRTEALLNRVFKLLGENFLTYPFLEKLNVYKSTVQNFPSNSDSKSVIDICEDYFKKGFEVDVEYQKFSPELISLLQCPELPLFVSKTIAEKLAGDVLKMSHGKTSVGHFITVVTSNPQLLKKKTFLKLLEIAVTFLPQAVQLKTVCNAYSDLLLYDDSLYSQDLVNLIMKIAYASDKYSLSSEAVYILRMGYLDENFVKYVSQFVLEKSKGSFKWNDMLNLANIFTQVSADHTMLGDIFEECKQFFLEYDFYNALEYSASKARKEIPVMDLYCSFITCLTYLGCDTRTLLNDFFSRAKNSLIYFKSLRELLLLHYVAKRYFPNECESLSPAVLNRLINLELNENDCLNLDECFNKDCLLRNCVNSDDHFFHFIALLGPDNKPINLSDYKSKQLPLNRYFNISELNKPPGSKLIAFQKYIHQYPYKFRNVPKKYGFYQLYREAFGNSGCEIVVLPPNFFNLSLQDKRKFLNKEINEVLGVSENSQ